MAQEALQAEYDFTDVRQPEDYEDDGLIVGGTHKMGYHMTYTELIMPLIKAVQELSAKVEALENK